MLTAEQIDELAEQALNAACLCIQEKLNVPSGDTAGQFFSGDTYDNAIQLFKQYIRTELWMQENY